MDPNTSTTEPDNDYYYQIALLIEPSFLPTNILIQTQEEPSKQILTKKPNTGSNQRFVILLRNLVSEQVTCRFDKTVNLNTMSSKTCSQFKFFLNTMEILCHYLNIIKPENYSYRLKDYGPYKKHLGGFPRKLETGSIITLQTYTSTLQNPDFTTLQEKIATLNRKDEIRKKISACCQEYAYSSAQYHLRLDAIFKELNRLGAILDSTMSSWKQENQKLSSVVFEEGIWDHAKKSLYTTNIKDLLKGFESSIRIYEQSLIKCTIALVDFEVEDAKRYKYSYGELKTEGSINNLNCYESPPNDIYIHNILCKTEESVPSHSHNLSQLFSDSTLGKSPRFGRERSHLNLLEPQSENVTPNLHLMKQRLQRNSSSKVPSTLPPISEGHVRGFGRAGLEVRPWGDGNIQHTKNLSYMTPTEGKRNFSFRNADTSVAKVSSFDVNNKVGPKFGQFIKFYPNWDAMEPNNPGKLKEEDIKKENVVGNLKGRKSGVMMKTKANEVQGGFKERKGGNEVRRKQEKGRERI